MKLLILIKTLRNAQHITQADLADKLCMSTTNYQKIEKGTISLSVKRFLKICEILDVHPGCLLEKSYSSSHNSLFQAQSYLKVQPNQKELDTLRSQNMMLQSLTSITLKNLERLNHKVK